MNLRENCTNWQDSFKWGTGPNIMLAATEAGELR